MRHAAYLVHDRPGRVQAACFWRTATSNARLLVMCNGASTAAEQGRVWVPCGAGAAAAAAAVRARVPRAPGVCGHQRNHRQPGAARAEPARCAAAPRMYHACFACGALLAGRHGGMAGLAMTPCPKPCWPQLSCSSSGCTTCVRMLAARQEPCRWRAQPRLAS